MEDPTPIILEPTVGTPEAVLVLKSDPTVSYNLAAGDFLPEDLEPGTIFLASPETISALKRILGDRMPILN